MASSQYFWFQTRHGKSVPYGPDARSESSADPVIFRWLIHGAWSQQTSRGLSREEQVKAHLKERYGWIILHEDLAQRAGLKATMLLKLRALLGPPQAQEGLLIWRL
jgi:hypothetical protein